MHHIYHTEGFIIQSINSSEANKTYYIFTRDFGLIRATAQGVRLLKSKLRYSLSTFSKAELSLVRGKDIWRIVGAKSAIHFKDIANTEDDPLGFVSRVLLFLLRFVHGEDKNEMLFSFLDMAFSLFETFTGKKEVEILCIYGILHYLGYIKDKRGIVQMGVSSESIDLISKNKKEIIGEINMAIKESHL